MKVVKNLLLILFLIFFTTSVIADIETYETANKHGILGSTYFLSLGIQDDMEFQKKDDASVGLTLITFASNVQKLTGVYLWILITDIDSTQILKIQAEDSGTIESEGWVYWTSISFWTTNFPNKVIFYIGVTFFELDTGGGSNSNTPSFINIHTYSFIKETSSKSITISSDDDAVNLSFGLSISTLIIFVLLRKCPRSQE